MPASVEEKTVCSISGLLAVSGSCPGIKELFATDMVENDRCTGHGGYDYNSDDEEDDEDDDESTGNNDYGYDDNQGNSTGNNNGGGDTGTTVDPPSSDPVIKDPSNTGPTTPEPTPEPSE